MRRRFTLVTLAVITLIVVSFVVPLAIVVRRQARDGALATAESDARSIATALAVAASFGDMTVDAEIARAVIGAFGLPEETSIHLPDGSVVGEGSPGDPDVEVARTGRAFTADTPDGAAVLIPVVAGTGTAVVRVAVSDAELEEGVATAWLILGALAVVLTMVALAGAERLGRSIVSPVRDLRSAAASLGGGDLDTRVVPAGPPEIAEVGRTFNELAERLRDLLQAEREATADLSHSLRTPLAALRLQVESLDEDTRRELIDDIVLLEATVDRVITEARFRGEETPLVADLSEVAAERIAFWSVLAAEQGRPFSSEVPDDPVMVGAPPADVSTVVDTLLENVFSHTEAGVPILVRVESSGILSVEDGGAGFGEAASERGTGSGLSTGLGLDIVRRIAARSGGEMKIERSETLAGAAARVRFGLRSPGGP